ncbi:MULTISPECIES: alpha/beta fold hydrolase [unclassified Saccharothrix]|uniref:alpha/beta fold hydrolase n=1 Tax=unclassified Saccharothrix TaxID=2593673 RepID=UPI00307F3AE1
MTSALVLAHGAGGSVRANFSPVIPVLSRSRRVFSVDYPGSGTTPRATGPLSLDDLADRVVASAGDTPTFAVLGYSLGCAVAVRAAVRHSERVTGLVLTSGFVKADDETRARTAKWRRLLGGDPLKLARYQLSLVVGEPFERAMPAEQREGMLELMALTVPPGTDEQIDLVERVDLSGDVGRVNVPTLVIGTKHDRLISPSSTRALADAIPGARWAELDSGHAPALEAPTGWTRLIEDFLG